MQDLTFCWVKVHVPMFFPFLEFREVFCRMFASDSELMHRYMAVSSSKKGTSRQRSGSLILDLTCSGRSLM